MNLYLYYYFKKPLPCTFIILPLLLMSHYFSLQALFSCLMFLLLISRTNCTHIVICLFAYFAMVYGC